MTLSVHASADRGSFRLSFPGVTVSAEVSAPRVALLSGAAGELRLIGAGEASAEWELELGGVRATGRDVWSPDAGTLERTVTVSGPAGEGARLESAVLLDADPAARYLAPGMVYSPQQWTAGVERSFADSRLAYPVVARWTPADRAVLWLARQSLATEDLGADRQPGQSDFLHRTDIGSVGFVPGADRLVASLPYREGAASAMLDAAGTPAAAFAPVAPGGTVLRAVYRIAAAAADSYVDAVTAVFSDVLDAADPQPTDLPVPYEESIDLRLDSASRTWVKDPSGFAAFVLNFDPERGYPSTAKAFGASFADHAMTGARDVIEYGFTGRQLNLAYLLARRDGDWLERSRAVVDSFVEHMATESGFVHTLWNLREGRPLFAVGDTSGPVMHYLGRSELQGTYTRMMAEAGNDLLLNIGLHRELGADVSEWREAALRLGSFFVRAQEPDGSWFRAYTPDGEAIAGTDWFGDRVLSGKSATGTVVPFLVALAEEAGDEAMPFLDAARAATRFILDHHVGPAEYRGGTLDNPNLVDKEAAFVAMRALLAVADADPARADELIEGARQAAEVAITWHSIQAVPNIPGTPLGRAGARSVGWGGINSVWGVGVTDIYSLFFVADLHRLGTRLGIERFQRIASLIAASSLQMLAVPGALHGFADAGMQPEGISFCPQGVDEGLIGKGDTWGGLGWPYTAGTFGLGEYLAAVATDLPVPVLNRTAQ
ncbi:hypothetical protein [Naasia sp. SYSU D00057]|uniref:hypothetical protein n=1 Tax=Naasia sp. SYSU D00057 TaxID=2817380 RepID=UPI001B30B471|nr:hypothetical protein [Naasia sp. SYSU D00057]